MACGSHHVPGKSTYYTFFSARLRVALQIMLLTTNIFNIFMFLKLYSFSEMLKILSLNYCYILFFAKAKSEKEKNLIYHQ